MFVVMIKGEQYIFYKTNFKKFLIFLIIVLILLFPNISTFADNDRIVTPVGEVVDCLELKSGINNVDINSDGVDDVILVGYRNNINAYSFKTVSFYINNEIKKDENIYNYHIVAIDNMNNITHFKDEYIFYVPDGDGESTISDLKMIKIKGSNIFDILFFKKVPSTHDGRYNDSKETIFSLYRLFFDDYEQRFIFKKFKEWNTESIVVKKTK